MFVVEAEALKVPSHRYQACIDFGAWLRTQDGNEIRGQ